MKFIIAKRELSRLAKGKYYSLQFELTQHAKDCGNGTELQCGVYVDGSGWHTAPSWKEALALLRNAMHPKQYREELPELSD